MIGIVTNILIFLICGSILCVGGDYDSNWDYHYDQYPQWVMCMSGLASAIVEIFMLKMPENKKYLQYVIYVSNCVFWFAFFRHHSQDPKTYICYFMPLGLICFIIAVVVSTIVNILVFNSTRFMKTEPITSSIYGAHNLVRFESSRLFSPHKEWSAFDYSLDPVNPYLDDSWRLLLWISSQIAVRHEKEECCFALPKSSELANLVAPECLAEDYMPIKATDVWSIGILMYEIVEGHLPMIDNKADNPLSGLTFSSSISQEMRSVILSCLAKEPWSRIPARQLVAEAQVRLSKKKTCSLNLFLRIKQFFSSLKNKRYVSVGIVASVVIVFFVGLFYWIESRQDSSKGDQDSEAFAYDGETLKNKPYGWGTAVYPDCSVYRGEWIAGERNGLGTMIFNDGRILFGEWKADSLDLSTVPLGQHETVYGIDISKYQGRVDWPKLAIPVNEKRKYVTVPSSFLQPIGFVFIKATEGADIVDPMFQENFDNARKYGIPRGCYHIYSTLSPIEEQFRNFVSKVPVVEGDLPPMLDIEPETVTDVDKVGKDILTWLDLVWKHYRCVPGIYIRQSLIVTDSSLLGRWIAGYDRTEWLVDLNNVPTGNLWKFWQFSHHAKIRGISSGCEVDLNKFNGTFLQFEEFRKNDGQHKLGDD